MLKPLLLASVLLVLSASTTDADDDVPQYVSSMFAQGWRVLDGDTLVIDGQAIRIAGMDAPELGPWARCWAEAALAGHAKSYVEQQLSEGSWKLIGASSARGRGARTARVVRHDGQDLAKLLVVSGHAANATVRWDWCGENANLHHVLEDEPKPHGPNLWWPTGHVLDDRAAD